MKRSVIPLILNPIKTFDAVEFVVELNDPGTVVDCVCQISEPKISLVTPGQQQMPDLIPVVMVLIDPDAPKSKHSFVMLPPTKILESENNFEYRGRFLFPNGIMLFLFEQETPVE